MSEAPGPRPGLLKGPSAYKLEVWGDRAANLSFLVVPAAIALAAVAGGASTAAAVLAGFLIAAGLLAIILANFRIGPSKWKAIAEARAGYTTLPGLNYPDLPLISIRTADVVRAPGAPEVSYKEYARRLKEESAAAFGSS